MIRTSAGTLGHAWYYILRKHEFVCHFPEHQPRQAGGKVEEGRAARERGQGAGELTVAHGLWGGGVEGAGHAGACRPLP
jgi:hypothetical protein